MERYRTSEPAIKELREELRQAISSRTLDELERMLNASKGAGTTTLLIEAAKKRNITLVTHSQAWADKLMEDHRIVAKPYTARLGGERVLIDNGVAWLLLKEAQKLRRLMENYLNHIERKEI